MALLNVGLGYFLGVIWLRRGGGEQIRADSPPVVLLAKMTSAVRDRLVPARRRARRATGHSTSYVPPEGEIDGR